MSLMFRRNRTAHMTPASASPVEMREVGPGPSNPAVSRNVSTQQPSKKTPPYKIQAIAGEDSGARPKQPVPAINRDLATPQTSKRTPPSKIATTREVREESPGPSDPAVYRRLAKRTNKEHTYSALHIYNEVD